MSSSQEHLVHMGPVNFHMTDGAILYPRIAQVMEGGGYAPNGGGGGVGPQVGVTFEAEEPHIRADEHARIGRPVWFMTGCASFGSDRNVFKSKGSALVAVALEAGRLICRNFAQDTGEKPPVRIMTIDAVNGAFHQAVPVGPLKLSHLREVACSAYLYGALGFRLVNRVA
jgi:hypothetical protein